jgi:hypothetical protein
MQVRFLAVITLGATLFILTYAGAGLVTRTSGTPEPWPAFVMTYRTPSDGQVEGTEITYQVWRIDYRNSNSWTKELIADDSLPERVGSTEVYDGKNLARFDASTQSYMELPDEDGVTAAAGRWLVPKSVEDHKKRGFTESGGSSLSRTDTIACVDIAECPADGVTQLRTVLEVDEHGIPLKVVESTDWSSILAFEAIELELR